MTAPVARMMASDVSGAVVADAVDDASDGLLDVHIGIFGAYLSADHHEAAAAECLTCYFGCFVLTEELVEDGV